MADQPDFENMSPEEIMAWMETLAKRQGATEGFTTQANLDIPEIDPDTVVIDEPGYVPYSETRASSATEDTQTQRPAAMPPPAVRPPSVPEPAVQRPAAAVTPPERPTAAPVPVARPATPPVTTAPVRPVTPQARPPAQTPAASTTPAWSVPRTPAPAPAPAPKPAAEPQGSLAWLESLAQQNDDNLFNLDLSGMGEESTPEATATDPAAWLESLAAAPDLDRIATPEDAEDSDSLRWLESLAKRQGAPAAELTTPADLEITEPKAEPEPPAYTPFSFDTAPTLRTVPARPAADPSEFLGSLAQSEGYSEAGVMATREPEPPAPPAQTGETIDEIKLAIHEGRATPEQMQQFFEHQMDVAEQLPPGPDELGLDEDAPPVPADIPDWLLEQVQVDSPLPAPALSADVPPLESLFDRMEPDIPDWLRDEELASEGDLQNIFAQPEDETPSIAVDLNDPWVEALDQEHTQGVPPVNEPPPWYLQNISDPTRLAALDISPSDIVLNNEPLPADTELAAGQVQAIPDWINTEIETPATPADEEPVADEIPEWLHELENVVPSSEIPAWLNEPVDLDAGLPFTLEEAPATPEFVIDQSAAPAPAQEVAPAEGAPSLASARQRRESGDAAGALAEYEALIRSGAAVQDAVDDLAHVARVSRDNPVVFRVLGDGYMRLGKLQQALDTYREALNHL